MKILVKSPPPHTLPVGCQALLIPLYKNFEDLCNVILLLYDPIRTSRFSGLRQKSPF